MNRYEYISGKEKDPKEDDIKKLTFFKENILNTLALVENLKVHASEKSSLAWFLERMSGNDSGTWEIEVKKLKDEIDKLNIEGGAVMVSQRLCEIINSEFIKFLNELIEKEEADSDYKENLKTIVEMCEDSLEDLADAKKDGDVVAFGGVSKTFIPKWFPQDEFADKG